MKRKSEAFTQAIVGLFMITVLLLLGYFTIVISGVDVLAGRHRVPVRFVFDQVGGLKDRDNVMYRGTKVGAIEHVGVTPSNLVVTAMIDSDVILRGSYRATVCNLSMLGGYYLKLEEGSGDKLDLGITVFNGESPTDWMEDVSSIAKNVNAFTSGPEFRSIVTNVEAAAVKARAFADQAERMVGEAKSVVEEVKGSVEDAKAFITKINGIADKVTAVAERVERGEGMVGKLLSSDETAYNDLKATLANAKEVTEKLNRDKTFTDLEAGVAAFREAAEGLNTKEMTAKANNLLENLNAVAEKLKNGEGTLGKLANQPDLYNEVEGLMKDVRQVLDNYRDTTPISTFSSLATGAL